MTEKSVSVICKICQRVQDSEEIRQGKFRPRKPIENEDLIEDSTIEDLDNEFQGMLDSIEDQINSDSEEIADLDSEEIDTKANLNLEIVMVESQAEGFQKDPLEDLEDQEGQKGQNDQIKENEMNLEGQKGPLEEETMNSEGLKMPSQVLLKKVQKILSEDQSKIRPWKVQTGSLEVHQKGQKRPLKDQMKPFEDHKSQPKKRQKKSEPEEGQKWPVETIKRPLEDKTNFVKAIQKRPAGKDFQCWQCLVWFCTKEDLKVHSCLNELNITGNFLYTCHFCATCSPDIDSLRPHVAKCKKFNLAPLKCFQKIESAMTSTQIVTSSPGRSTRHKKTDSNPKCESCSVIFASKAELVLHNSKAKCKSLQCGLCKKNFAMEASLQNHHCDSKISERVDQDIKVIKLDRSKYFHQPAKCFECGNLLQSFELLKAHQNIQNFCGSCNKKFPNSCQLLRHECSGPEKKAPVKVKTEPGITGPSGPIVVLKNVNDSNVPAITDGHF